MTNKRQHIAARCGAKLAGMWKTAKRWDAACVNWSVSHKLPGWLGHVPVALFLLLTLAIALAGGALASFGIVTVLCIVSLFSGRDTRLQGARTQSYSYRSTSAKDHSIFSNTSETLQPDKFTEYSILNGEYDGSPYKSPAED